MKQKFEKYKYYRLLEEPTDLKVKTPLSMALHSLTGFYSNDYIKLVLQQGSIVNVISDESCLKNYNYSCVSLIAMNQFGKNHNEVEEALEDLINRYGLESIHFTEIFGRKKILGQRRNEFLNEYATIVSKIPMLCVAFSRDKKTLLNQIAQEYLSQEEIYFNLFWSSFEFWLPAFEANTIFHISYEVDFEPHKISYKLGNRLIDRHQSGIFQLIENTQKHISICKHPHFFSKQALFYSSISDCVAYITNTIQSKVHEGIPENKILSNKNCVLMLRLIKRVFVNYSGLAEIRHLIEKV